MEKQAKLAGRLLPCERKGVRVFLSMEFLDLRGCQLSRVGCKLVRAQGRPVKQPLHNAIYTETREEAKEPKPHDQNQ